jgi:NitT/TauT family transport system substrate-binding protein
VSLWEDPFRPAFDAFFKAQGLKPEIVPQHTTVNLFLLRGVDACSVMGYNEYRSLYLSGIDEGELSRFPLKGFGVDFPEDGIYCLRKTREERPEVCRSIAEATIEGWRYAADHFDEAIETVMGYVDADHLPTNRTQMRWMLRSVLPSVLPGGEKPWEPGVLRRDAYDAARKWLLDLGEVKAAPAYEELVR